MKKLLLTTTALAIFSCPALAQSSRPTTNFSVSITAGNSYQTITNLPAGSPRSSLTIQNNNVNGDNCWLFLGSGTATKGASILLAQGQSYGRYYPYVPSDAIQVTCATSLDTLYVDAQ